MSNQESDLDKYYVVKEQEGRGGYVYYIEHSRLPFPWEILGTKGIGVSVPSIAEWDLYCEKYNAEWAKGRRTEVLQRIAKALLKDYGDGSFEISDFWLNILPRPTFFSKFF